MSRPAGDSLGAGHDSGTHNVGVVVGRQTLIECVNNRHRPIGLIDRSHRPSGIFGSDVFFTQIRDDDAEPAACVPATMLPVGLLWSTTCAQRRTEVVAAVVGLHRNWHTTSRRQLLPALRRACRGSGTR